MTRARTSWAGLVLLLIAVGAIFFTVAYEAEAGGGRQVCHPVNGKGETGHGWNLIGPNQASSHIDEATGAGKHTSRDGRTDVYAVDGQCPGGEPPVESPYPYEVDACWTMSHTDGVEGTYQWPQTRGCQPPACGETVEQQHDTYWIRDEADEAYLAGLTGLGSSADDARLEPHGYYSTVLTGEPCTEPSETPTPTQTPSVTPSPSETPSSTPPVVETPSSTPSGSPSDTPTITTPPVPAPSITTPAGKPPFTIPPTVGPPAVRSSSKCVGGSLITTTEKFVDGSWRTVETSSDATKCNAGRGAPPVLEEGF